MNSINRFSNDWIHFINWQFFGLKLIEFASNKFADFSKIWKTWDRIFSILFQAFNQQLIVQSFNRLNIFEQLCCYISVMHSFIQARWRRIFTQIFILCAQLQNKYSSKQNKYPLLSNHCLISCYYYYYY